MNRDKIIYWVATGIMCLIFVGSALMYFTQYEEITKAYTALGFASWLVIPSAIVKLLGTTAVLTKKSTFLKEWAYAGFFFDATLAFAAHTIAGDGQGMLAAIAVVATVVSRFYDGRLFPR